MAEDFRLLESLLRSLKTSPTAWQRNSYLITLLKRHGSLGNIFAEADDVSDGVSLF